jgi:alcohol dehydrogenase
MLSVHLEGGRVEVRRRPLPRVPAGFARIRLLAAGICSTDLELQRGYYGFSGTPGHEFVGEVTEADDKTWIGKRVVGEINLACGACSWCARDLGRHCPHRTVLGIVKHPGAFREFLTLPVRNLHPVPAALPTEHAVFVEPVAAACEILDEVGVPAGMRVAVLGDGKLGLLVDQMMQAHGARVDATGSSGGLQAAIGMCEPRGTVVMKSTVHGLVKVDSAPAIVNEVTLVGSRCGRFLPAIRLLASGKVHVAAMIADEFPLDQAKRAFAKAAERGVLKVLLRAN